MKFAFLIFILSITFVVQGQDSLLNKAWIKLTTQFKNRIQVADEFGTFALDSKFVDTATVNYLKQLSFSLTKRLHEAVVPTRPAIDSIRTENLLFIGAISKVLVLLEDDRDFRQRSEFKNFQASLMSAENRIAFARKELNKACKTINREDLIY